MDGPQGVLDGRQVRQQILPRVAAAARGPQQIAMLTFDLGVDQRLRQTQAGRLVGQRAILADAPLHLAGRRHQAGGVVAAGRQPVNADAMFDATAKRLRGELREAVQQNGIDAADGMFGFGLVARPDHEAVAAATDLGALGDDVQGRAVAVGRKETDGIVLGFALLADLFRQADGSEGAAGAEPFVVGDGRPFDGLPQAAGLGDGGLADRRGPRRRWARGR